MKLMKIGAGTAATCLVTGLVMVMLACFHSGVSWVPEAFSFMKNLFGM